MLFHPLHLQRLTEKQNAMFKGLRIAEYTGISYSILFDGLVMILLHGNQRSLLMAYRLLRSFINGIQGNLDNWKMFLDDLEPRRGILSRHSEEAKILGRSAGAHRGCGRKCATERHRLWKMLRR